MSTPTISWIGWGGKVHECKLPQTQEEYDRLLENQSYLTAPQHKEEECRALHSVFGGGFTFEQWIPMHTQAMNIAIIKQKKQKSQREKRAKLKKAQQEYEDSIHREAQRRLQQERFEKAVQDKLHQIRVSERERELASLFSR